MSIPTIEILQPSLVAFNTATLNGRIIETEPEPCGSVGYVYDVISHANPTDSHYYDDTDYAYNIYTEGSYPADDYPMAISGLLPGTKYYVRFGVFGADGGIYSDEFTFFTDLDTPGLGWQFMMKNQVDAEKIEEAILRLITNHNEDPESHLDPGESLQSHKAYAIIDHIAKSIVEDKIDDGAISSRCITADQIIGKDFRTALDVGAEVDGVLMNSLGIQMWYGGVQKVNIGITGDAQFRGKLEIENLAYERDVILCNFESLDGFTIIANVQRLTLGTGHIETNGNLNAICKMYCITTAEAVFNWSNCPTLEVVAKSNHQNTCKAFVGMGADMPSATYGWVAIYIYSGTAYLAAHPPGDVSFYVTTIGAFDDTVYHKYRIEVPNGAAFYAYIDDVYNGYMSTHLPVTLGTPFGVSSWAQTSLNVCGWDVKSFIFFKNKTY